MDSKAKHPRWSEAEQKALKAHYKAISSRDLEQAFPGRTSKAIENQAHRMGLHKLPARIAEASRNNALGRWRKAEEAPEADTNPRGAA